MTVHNEIADVIRAAGFDMMAKQYLNEPAMRAKVVEVMRRNIARDPKMGHSVATRFAHLARHADD